MKFIGQAGYFVLVMSQIEGSVPVECLAAKDVKAQHHFNPLVAHVAHVCLKTVIDIRRSRHFIGVKHVGSFLVIPFNASAQATVKQGEVQTYV
ncbi:hypothetical protein Barb7_03031 [Bacteroidales bacterium Barb7]|nr:hypothetical protein Barb7_03031 [Bacteroidales bacterium Barb7]